MNPPRSDPVVASFNEMPIPNSMGKVPSKKTTILLTSWSFVIPPGVVMRQKSFTSHRLCLFQERFGQSKHLVPSRIVSDSFVYSHSHFIKKIHQQQEFMCSYCLNETKPSDPFRNDTRLRPYACSPGTFCVAGTGSNEVHEGTVWFAQPCTAGFFLWGLISIS